MINQLKLVAKFMKFMEFHRHTYGAWLNWPDEEWGPAQRLAIDVEALLGTDHFDRETCTGFPFAAKVYNEMLEGEDRMPEI